jgi:hypothetical protein
MFHIECSLQLLIFLFVFKVHFAKKEPNAGPTQGLGALSSSVGERRASLRRCNSFLQDIASFAPMIESVACKATGAKSGKSSASEISSKYENLNQQAIKIYEKQKETIKFEQVSAKAEYT